MLLAIGRLLVLHAYGPRPVNIVDVFNLYIYQCKYCIIMCVQMISKLVDVKNNLCTLEHLLTVEV